MPDPCSSSREKFASGSDKMLAFRQIYAANRLLRRGVTLSTALELTEAARAGVDAALEVPGVTVAAQAECATLGHALAQEIAPDVPEASRNSYEHHAWTARGFIR